MVLNKYKSNGGEGFVDAADLSAAGQVSRGEGARQVYYWNLHAKYMHLCTLHSETPP